MVIRALIVLSLLLSSTCFAGVQQIRNVVCMASVQSSGASCDSSTADVCEDWDGPSTYRLTWNDTTTGGSLTPSAHSGTLSCTDKGTNAQTVTYTSQADLYTYTDLGSAQNVIYVNFYFIVTDRPNMINGTVQSMIRGGSTTGGQFPGLTIVFREIASEQLQVGVKYNNNSAELAYTNISEDTWYRVSALYSSDGVADDNDDIVTWWLDGVQQDTVTTANLTLAQRPRYIAISSNAEVAGSVDINFQIDNLEIDYTSMPDACP